MALPEPVRRGQVHPRNYQVQQGVLLHSRVFLGRSDL